MTRDEKGQSLFEVVLALAVVALIIVAIVILATTSVRNASFSRNQSLATRYAQEATEWLRGQRDEGWDIFTGNIVSCAVLPHIQCLDTLAWGNCDSCSDAELLDEIYERKVSFECKKISGANPEGDPRLCSELDVNAVHTTIEVSWDDSQGSHMARSVTTFSDWREQ